MSERSTDLPALHGPRIGRRGFLGTLGFAAGIAALPQVAAAWSATAPASAADAGGTLLNAWDIDSFTLSYPRYAEAIPHPRRAAPVVANLAGAESLDQLFLA